MSILHFPRHNSLILPETVEVQSQPTPQVKPVMDYKGFYRYEKYSKETIMETISFGVTKKPTFYKDCQGKAQQSSAYSIIHNDTGHELGSVTKQYNIITHAEVLEPALNALHDLDYTFKTVAMKNHGGRVLIEAVSPNNPITINGETHIPRVIIKNSYDATTSVSIQFGLFRMVCTNGIIAPAFKGSSMNLTTRHSSGAKDALLNWQQVLQNTNWIDSFKTQLEKLDTKIDTVTATRILAEIWGVVENKVSENKNIKDAVFNAFYGQGQSGDTSKTLTKWDVFNGITQTLRDKVIAADETQLYSRLDGVNAKTLKALELLLAA